MNPPLSQARLENLQEHAKEGLVFAPGVLDPLCELRYFILAMTIEIQTPRVQLRKFQNSDYENMRLLESDPDVVRFTPMRVPQTPEQTRHKLKVLVEKTPSQRPFGVWACEFKATQEFVGWFMLQSTNLEFPELGFMLVQKYWKQGLAIEIATGLVDYALKDLHVAGVSARTDKSNAGSIRVLEKLGFQRDRQMEESQLALGGNATLNFFRLLNPQNVSN